MREIRFRGKRIDNGEWVYGYLLVTQMSGVYIIGTKTKSKSHKIGGEVASVSMGDVIWQHEVNPATVGQYTGLKDKNGKEIYEGDILQMYRHSDDTHKHEKDYISPVYFKGGTFFVQIKKYQIDQSFLHMARPGQSLEAIDNIYDNPDLLEVSL